MTQMTKTMMQGLVGKMSNSNSDIFVADFVEAARSEGMEVTKAELLEAHKAHTITLRRYDLMTSSLRGKIQASEIRGMAGSTFHTVGA